MNLISTHDFNFHPLCVRLMPFTKDFGDSKFARETNKTQTHTCQPPEYKNLETTPKIFKVEAIFISGPFFFFFLVFTFFDAITVHYLGN